MRIKGYNIFCIGNLTEFFAVCAVKQYSRIAIQILLNKRTGRWVCRVQPFRVVCDMAVFNHGLQHIGGQQVCPFRSAFPPTLYFRFIFIKVRYYY